MSANDHSKEIAALLKKLRAEFGAASEDVPSEQAIDPCEPLMCEFVRSMMTWESTSAKAAAVMKRFAESVVDCNELRVCLADELVRIMGERYPRVEERALRLRAALNDLYSRQHAVSLEHLATLGKREAKEYMDGLDGVPRFVSARLSLLRLDVHAAPVDGRILKRLIEAGIAEPGMTPEAAAGLLERGVRAGELGEAYRLLQAWSDQAPLGFSETPASASIDDHRRKKDSRVPAAGSAEGSGAAADAGKTRDGQTRGAAAKPAGKRKSAS